MMIKSTGEEGSLVGTPPGDYLDGQTESIIDSTGKDWSAIRSTGKM